MRGLAWDDLGRGTSASRGEIRFYDALTAVLLADYGVSFGVREDADQFFRDAMTGDYDFVTVDLKHANAGPIGKQIAIDVRLRMAKERRDSDFPIFLLSSSPEEFSVNDAYTYSVYPVAKHLDFASLVAQQITFRLKESGRFSRDGEVLILARNATINLSGQTLNTRALEELRLIVKAAGCRPEEVAPESFSRDILDALRLRIREADRIVVLVTKDEPTIATGFGTASMARPNIYLELGLVLGLNGGDRKLILIQEEGAYLPSDIGSHQPITYRGDLLTIKERIDHALKRQL